MSPRRILKSHPQIVKLAALSVMLAFGNGPAAGAVTILVRQPHEPAHRAFTPVSLAVDLQRLFGTPVDSARLLLAEVSQSGAGRAVTVPVQFVPEVGESLRGRLWWLLPPTSARERHFRLSVGADKIPPALRVEADENRVFYDIMEGTQPVLRYNHGTVPVPPGVDTNYARGDYIMPLFGPDGERLTDDYPKDHPHHRGISWSWPVTRWGKEVRDIWAVRGVWARPVAMPRIATGPVFARLEAENVWKWGDTNAMVREQVVIRAFRESGDDRLVDVEIRLLALAKGVAIGGRPQAGYGGFGLRAMPARQRAITRHVDPPEAAQRRSWLDYSGHFDGGRGAVGLAIFEHVGNLHYPNTLLEYPDLNYVMPAFPGDQEVPLTQDIPLVLRHRLWIHSGMADATRLEEVWAAYANPPSARITSATAKIEGR